MYFASLASRLRSPASTHRRVGPCSEGVETVDEYTSDGRLRHWEETKHTLWDSGVGDISFPVRILCPHLSGRWPCWLSGALRRLISPFPLEFLGFLVCFLILKSPLCVSYFL